MFLYEILTLKKCRHFKDKIEFRWEIYSKIDAVNGEKLFSCLRYVNEWLAAKVL